jgi:pyridoxal phosphate enzyme (YggS family)
MYTSRLADKLPRVRDTVAEAAERSGRRGDEVTVVAITKAHPLAAIEAALAAGIHDIGENRIEEMEGKVAALGRDAAHWHMVGHVQSRKASRAVAVADLVHSVDSVRLGEKLSRAAEAANGKVAVLVQVNTSGEEAKHGFNGENALEGLHELLELPGLQISGLMTMAPWTDDERTLRAAFRRLREIHEEAARSTEYSGSELSMGMTNDYPIAVEEGSTMVRIGTALFGERPR